MDAPVDVSALAITVVIGVALFALLGKDPLRGLQLFFVEPLKDHHMGLLDAASHDAVVLAPDDLYLSLYFLGRDHVSPEHMGEDASNAAPFLGHLIGLDYTHHPSVSGLLGD